MNVTVSPLSIGKVLAIVGLVLAIVFLAIGHVAWTLGLLLGLAFLAILLL